MTESLPGHGASRPDGVAAEAQAISVIARELAVEIERERRLPDALLTPLRNSGLLRAGAPVEVGGLELPPGVALRCAEEVARGDASAGWCVSIAITSSLLAAYLPDGGRTELFGDGRAIAAGVWAPSGTAHRERGGVVVSGRWGFCSGITHADLLFAGCMIDGDPTQSEERPQPRVVAIRKQDLEILDTWHTLGLRGTGSHDTVATNVFVPDELVLSLFDGPAVNRPLYRFPVFGFFALSVAAAAMGNARAAIDELISLAAVKVGQGSRRTIADRGPTQRSVAAADASLRRGAGVVLRSNRIGMAGRPARRTSAGRVAQRPPLGGNPRRTNVGGGRGHDVRARGEHRRLRRRPAPATVPRRAHRRRALPGQRSIPGAPGPDPARPAGRPDAALSERGRGLGPGRVPWTR